MQSVLGLARSPVSRTGGAVWLTLTFRRPANASTSVGSLLRAASISATRTRLVPWAEGFPGNDSLVVPALAMAKLNTTSFSREQPRSEGGCSACGAVSAGSIAPGASWLPGAGGGCHGWHAAERSARNRTWALGRRPSHISAPGEWGVGLAGAGRVRAGRECLVDDRGGSAGRWRLPQSIVAHAAVLVLVPPVPLSSIEPNASMLLQNAALRPRVAGAWAWDAALGGGSGAPGSWVEWRGARASLTEPPSSQPAPSDGAARWGLSLALLDRGAWPAALHSSWPFGNHTAPPGVTVRAWGEVADQFITPIPAGQATPNGGFELPLGAWWDRSAAALVAPAAVAVAAGTQHSVALLEDGTVRVWGLGSGGRLGYGSEFGSPDTIGDRPGSTPATAGPVPLGGPAVAVAAGSDHTVVLLAEGTVWAFGRAGSGQLGYGSTMSVGGIDGAMMIDAGPVPIGGVAVSVRAGGPATGAILSDGSARMWGSNAFGNLGVGSDDDVGGSPTRLPGTAGIVRAGGSTDKRLGFADLALSALHSIFLLTDGSLRGCGTDPQAGHGTAVELWCNAPGTSPPQAAPLDAGGRVVAVAVGPQHTLAVMEDGTLLSFGSGAAGRLGRGSTQSVVSLAPARPVDLGGRAMAVAAAEHSMVVMVCTDGRRQSASL